MYVFIETRLFSRLVSEYLSEDQLAELQEALSKDPEAGVLIPGSGGLRKIRWAGSGHGKRGGIRIIYYWRRPEGVIWLLTIYAENEAESIPIRTLRMIAEEIDNG